MKTAAKILNIITIIASCFGAFTFLIVGILFLVIPINEFTYNSPTPVTPEELKAIQVVFNTLGIVFLCVIPMMAIPIVLAIVCNKKIDKATSRDSIIGWAVVDLIFVNFISGILLFIAAFDDNKKDDVVEAHVEVTHDNVAIKLKQLNSLRDNCLITDEEYNKKRKEILDSI